jgi:hypothetical protein
LRILSQGILKSQVFDKQTIVYVIVQILRGIRGMEGKFLTKFNTALFSALQLSSHPNIALIDRLVLAIEFKKTILVKQAGMPVLPAQNNYLKPS